MGVFYRMCVCVWERERERERAQSHPTLCDPGTVACQAPLSMRISRQEYWNGLLFPPPGDLPDTGFELASPVPPVLTGELLTNKPPEKTFFYRILFIKTFPFTFLILACWSHALRYSIAPFPRPLKNLPYKLSKLRFPGFLYTTLEYIRSPQNHSTTWRPQVTQVCLQHLLPDSKPHSYCGLSRVSLLFSCSVVSNSLWPHRLQDARLHFPSLFPGVLLKLMSTESVMWSNHLVLCHPLLLLPSIFPSIRVFSSESVLHIRWPKYWSLNISPSNEYSGLISFRFDWLDLLAVQRSLKSLVQNHSSKASILQCSAFFMVQFSHLLYGPFSHLYGPSLTYGCETTTGPLGKQ